MKEPYAVITGATSGIGLEFARLFAADGIHVVLVSRRSSELHMLAKELSDSYGVDTQVFVADLSRLEEAEALYEFIDKQKFNTHYIINNAGIGDFGEFVKTSWTKEHTMIQLNVVSLTYLSKKFAERFSREGFGHIVNVASVAAFQPGPLMAVYYATKAYVLHFTEAIATELHKSGVRVTALCPGPTASHFQEAATMADSKLVKAKHLPTAAQVARYGYEAMKRGKVVAVYGTSNKVNAYIMRVLPRKTVRHLVHRIQSVE